MGERCFWCNTDPDEAAARFEGPHAKWCLRYSHAVAQRPPKWIMESNPGLPPDPREAFDRAVLKSIEADKYGRPENNTEGGR